MNLSETKQFMIDTAKEAGKIARENFQKKHDCRFKDNERNQAVCETDLEVEKLIKSRIREKYPGHSILAEESADSNNEEGSEYLWVVDPIDGTRNYMHGHPTYGISIALARNMEALLGVIYFPALDWMFSAEKGKGAEKNGKMIRVSQRDAGEDTLGNFGCAFHREKEQQMKQLDSYISLLNKIRIEGAATMSLCMVAEGVYDSTILRFVKQWDYAAGALIVSEAGGKVTGYNGEPASLDLDRIVASNRRFHDRLLEILKESPEVMQNGKGRQEG